MASSVMADWDSYPMVKHTPSYMTITPRKRKVSFHYVLKKNKALGLEYPLYGRIICARKKAEISMGIMMTPEEWNSKNHELRHKNQHPEIYQKLITMESDIIRIIQHRELKGLPVNAHIIKEIVKGRMDLDATDGNQYMLLTYLRSHILRITENTNEYTPGTVQHYRTLVPHLENYLRSIGLSDAPLHVLDTKFLQGFDDFLISWKNPKLGRAMNRNTANRNHSKLSALLHRAENERLIQKSPYSGFRLRRAKPQSDFLIDREIQLLIGKRLDNQSLELTRDYLLMSLFMGGLRFSDLKTIKVFNIIEEDGFHFLHLNHQEKTLNSVHTPLLPCAVAILQKYKKCQEETGFILPRLSQQKLNEYLKTLGDLAGVHKRMTHKIARHTFATTICSQNGVPRHLTAAWLGHFAQTRTTDIYARVTRQEALTWVIKLWGIYNKPEFIIK